MANKNERGLCDGWLRDEHNPTQQPMNQRTYDARANYLRQSMATQRLPRRLLVDAERALRCALLPNSRRSKRCACDTAASTMARCADTILST